LVSHDDTPEHASYDKRTPGLFKTEFTGMEWLPCVARPTFVLVQRINLAVKELTGKPTISIKARIWTSC
jgi:hypothetical protein